MRQVVIRHAFWATVVLGMGHLSSLAIFADEPGTPAQLDFFERKIRPVLATHCYECHATGDKPLQGGLSVENRAAIRRGGESGPAIVPGKPEESLLLAALRHESFEMPPDNKLPDEVIADFKRWIADGAADPREGEIAHVAMPAADLAAASKAWAFQSPQKTSPPAIKDTQWPHSTIDRFILARLESADLRPVDDAPREVLVRRLYFDLLGLPPTEEELQAALDDRAPDAVARLVDRLLENPAFGERWGRHWLDVVRYADSVGGGRSQILSTAWRYRDYVIQSFNQDKPFNVMIAEQIAGDLMPYDNPQQRAEQLTATAFLALGPKNLDAQDKEVLRMDVVDEQLDTLGRALMGMTLGCARCHDHKFDPIPTSDYYALAGILRSTRTLRDANVSLVIERDLPVDPAQQRAIDEHAEKVAQAERGLKDIKQQLTAARKKLRRAEATSEQAGIVVDDEDAQRVGDWKESAYIEPFHGVGYLHDDNAGKGEKSLTYKPNLPTAGWYEVRFSYTPGGSRAANTPITIHHADGDHQLALDQRQAPPRGELFTRLGEFRFAAGQSGFVRIETRGTTGHVTADAVQFLPVDPVPTPLVKDKAAAAERTKLEAEENDLAAQLKQGEAAIKELQSKGPPPPPRTLSVAEDPQPANCQINIRGNVHNLGFEAPRGFLSVVQLPHVPPINPEQSGRLELAAWITQPEHPLTARVFVNRVWLHMLGEGIVRTPDNFGVTGEAPTHPELLDHLAVEFVEDGWSVKRLIRRIALSRVYQISSHAVAPPTVDPTNKLLWRANRKRLEAEALRDAILTASGQLERTAGGTLLSASMQIEAEFEYTSTRRSVYLPVLRDTSYDLFEVFDFADSNLVFGRRNTSTLPTQALYLMNSPWVIDQAHLMAERLLDEPFADDTTRLRIAYLRTLGRVPSREEEKQALAFLAESAAQSADDSKARRMAWSGVCHALFACLDFRHVD